MKVKELIAKLQEFDGEFQVKLVDECDNASSISEVKQTYPSLEIVYIKQ
jgi:hypothetical protein